MNARRVREMWNKGQWGDAGRVLYVTASERREKLIVTVTIWPWSQYDSVR